MAPEVPATGEYTPSNPDESVPMDIDSTTDAVNEDSGQGTGRPPADPSSPLSGSEPLTDDEDDDAGQDLQDDHTANHSGSKPLSEDAKGRASALRDDDDESISSISSSTIPLSDAEGESDDGDGDVTPRKNMKGSTSNSTTRTNNTVRPPSRLRNIGLASGDDDGSDLTEDEDEDEENANQDDEDEDEDDDEDDEADEGASVPPPKNMSDPKSNSGGSSSNQPLTNGLTNSTKPSQHRKANLFGTDDDGDDDGELSELEDSDTETAQPMDTTEPVDATPEDGANVTTTTTAKQTGEAPRVGATVGDGEKPYSPPKAPRKKGAPAEDSVAGDTDADHALTEDEEEDEDEGGEGMLVKDAVRKESEAMAKKDVDAKEDEDEEKQADEDDVEAQEGEDEEIETNREDQTVRSPGSSKSKSGTTGPSTGSNAAQTLPTTSSLITNHLSSATPQTTLEALQALLQIEVKFSALRDQLYVERMNELSREEDVIADGTHPSLLHLHQILQDRRENLLRLAELRVKQNELELVRVRETDKSAVMSWWQDAKDTLVRQEYESNSRKKRKLDKDKADYESIRPPPRTLPPKLATKQDADDRMFAWESGPTISTLANEEIRDDLAQIGAAARNQYRQLQNHGAHGYRPQSHNIPGYGRSGHPMARPGHTVEETTNGMMVPDTGALMFETTGGSRQQAQHPMGPHAANGLNGVNKAVPPPPPPPEVGGHFPRQVFAPGPGPKGVVPINTGAQPMRNKAPPRNDYVPA